jgi:F420-non-reducing hydrogenase small subunit
VALDFKRKDVEALPDGAIAATFLNGAIRSTEQEEMAHLLRRKSQILIAFGACSHLGGIPGLANLWDRRSLLEAVYREAPSTVNPAGTTPQASHPHSGSESVTLPVLFDTVKTLEQTVAVDYFVPGCPPTPKILFEAVRMLLAGSLPEKGAVLAPDTALCEECPRRDTRPETLAIKEWKRPHEIQADPDKCLLAQGLLCLGSATRGGCEAQCTKGNMPCTGCFGPTSRVRDFGAKALSTLASIVDASEEKEIDRILMQIPDPVGTLYRYCLAASPLRRKKLEATQDV